MEFPRKEAPQLDASKDDLVFQITDWFIPESDKSARKLQEGQPYAPAEGDPPEYDIYIYGVTEQGDSVCAHVTGFEPYFYVKPPLEWAGKVSRKIQELQNELLEGTRYNARMQYHSKIIPRRLVPHLVGVEKQMCKDFWGFTNGKSFPFIKITVKSLALFNILQRYFREKADEGFKLYESNIDPFLRFIHERNIRPCGWARLKAKRFTLVEDDERFARTSYNVRAEYSDVHAVDINKIAPLMVASFDIECTSSHGDFPVASKTYRKLAMDMVNAARASPTRVDRDTIWTWVLSAFKAEHTSIEGVTIHQVFPTEKISQKAIGKLLEPLLDEVVSSINTIAALKQHDTGDVGEDGEEEIADATISKNDVTEMEVALTHLLTSNLPKLKGDPIIQIGTTVHLYGSDEIIYRHIATLNSCDAIGNADVECFDTEEDLIMGWRDIMIRLDPDIITGYNIFGFDMDYIWSRAKELGIEEDISEGFGRLINRKTTMIEQRLSSSALGDNILKYIDLDGIVAIDMFKVMQRDHKLDSYKLDSVATVFLGDHKEDLKPREIFEKFGGSSADRKDIATYCLQDCALCNRLMHKLKVLENNVGMANVCYVPLSYLFMRGQGVKIFSLVAKECKEKNYLIPVLKGFNPTFEDDTDGYEGAIVLEPKEGIYLEDPITVLDYSSLYPSSMIARNLSHDCFVNDDAYAHMEDDGITYTTVTYDVYEGKGDKKKCVGTKSCTFAQLPEGKKGIIPSILQKLLTQRKNTRKKIEYTRVTMTDGNVVQGLITKTLEDGSIELLNVDTCVKTTIDAAMIQHQESAYSAFEQAVLDALQLAYKVTANSLYGQIGSRTSPIYWKDIAACTTATGREMIMTAKNFVEEKYGAEVIYGDTDSIFIKFAHRDSNGNKVVGKEALAMGIAAGQRASREIKSILPPPQCLEYEKTLFPFILFSKKRYVGNLYEEDPNKKPKQKSMGIVLKRRDNANILKKVYGGIIDIILNQHDLASSVTFLQQQLQDMVDGNVNLQDLIITKTLRAEYKDPTKIAHKVLADRMAARDPGNKPMANDRIPFVYIRPPANVEVKLQGDRIEHPDYIRETNLKPDYRFYIKNQLINPICQLYALCVEKLPGYSYSPGYWTQIEAELLEKELYQDDKKRKDRISALRMREVEELLFEKYTSQLEEVKRMNKTTTKSKRPTTLSEDKQSDAFVVELYVEEKKEAKQYECKALVKDKDGSEVKCINVVIPKKRSVTTKQYCFRHMAELIFKELDVGTLSTGLRFMIDDKTFTRNWKSAITKHGEKKALIQEAINNQDIGAFRQLQEETLFDNLITVLDRYPYSIQALK